MERLKVENDREEKSNFTVEREVESKLEKLINSNPFLAERHQDTIDNAETSAEALEIAEDLVLRRLQAIGEYRPFASGSKVENFSPNVKGLLLKVENIIQNQQMVGEGNDGYVVINTKESPDITPPVCYKLAKKPKFGEERDGGRERNSSIEEADIQSQFRRIADAQGGLVGVPELLFSFKLDHHELIAMELLPAKSIRDIEQGNGVVPEWIDIDKFSDELERLVEEAHKQGLYHRDIHFGNVMISQIERPTEGDKAGYLIDFGRSDVLDDEQVLQMQKLLENPPQNYEANIRRDFTNSDNRVNLNAVRQFLQNYRKTSRGE